jgi:hypothetical protein
MEKSDSVEPRKWDDVPKDLKHNIRRYRESVGFGGEINMIASRPYLQRTHSIPAFSTSSALSPCRFLQAADSA